MKQKFLIIICGLMLCFGSVGCTYVDYVNATEEYKNYDNNSKLIAIKGEEYLYYYSDTYIVYIVFKDASFGYKGYGYMAPYYSKNGKLCIYDTEQKKLLK